MKIAGMNIVITETPMTKDQQDDFLNSLAEMIAEDYLEQQKEKE